MVKWGFCKDSAEFRLNQSIFIYIKLTTQRLRDSNIDIIQTFPVVTYISGMWVETSWSSYETWVSPMTPEGPNGPISVPMRVSTTGLESLQDPLGIPSPSKDLQGLWGFPNPLMVPRPSEDSWGILRNPEESWGILRNPEDPKCPLIPCSLLYVTRNKYV